MAGRHRELVAELRRLLGAARSAAAAAVTEAADGARDARQRHAATEAAARRDAHRLLAEQRRHNDNVDRGCLTELARAHAELTALAAEQAPGAAGAPWPEWEPTPPDGDRPAGLYRIGRLTTTQPAPAGDPGTEAPALVSLLDSNHLAIVDPGHRAAITTGGDAEPEPPEPVTYRPTDAVHGVIAAILLRILGATAPGSVRLTVYDPERLGGSLASFAPLASAGLLSFVGPGGLGGVLDEMVEQVRRINQTVLAGEYASLRELHAATGRRPEPWRIAVLLGEGTGGADELSAAQRAQLDRLVRTGPACGVHLVMSGIGEPGEWRDRMDTVVLVGDKAWTNLVGNRLAVALDPPPPGELVTRTCRAIADRVSAGPEPAAFAHLLPEALWAASSAERLVAPVGAGPDGRLVDVELGDSPPHALIGGPSGAGKTNLLYAWIGSLAARYGPDELALYLLDFKEGVSFARFAPGRRDESWLPQVRLVGVNVNADREYGLALLEYLHEQLRARAEAAKAHEATKLAELRAQDPKGHWPRIVAVIDEFQVLLDGRDQVALEAARLLEDLARRGRSQGIHLVLASQDLSGIDALWGRTSMVAQFTLRIALPKARRILVEGNTAADTIPRHHAVVNPDSGAAPANRIAHIPDAGTDGTLDALQRKLWTMRRPDAAPPVLFDGGAVPDLDGAADFLALAPDETGPPRAPVALLGQTIDVTGRSASLRLSRSPGRNLAVLGARIDEACDVLAAAVRSLARQYRPGAARFSLVCLDDDAVDATKQELDRLRAAGHDVDWYDRDQVRELLAEAAQRVRADEPSVPHVVAMYAVDAAAGVLARKDTTTRRSARDDLGEVLSRGPEMRTHVLGWWRSVPRLRDDLGGLGARFDAFGAWLALDVQGAELGPLSTQPGGPAWYPRVRRALFFDRAVHRVPQLMIPYRTGESP
jgi:DNA segregation ATPase FtsK/SpoIIIE, S-DNA-T family